jgi:hypothetical protein
MSGKKSQTAVSRERHPEEEDKENKKIYANLRVNNINKDLEDVHLFKLSKKNLFAEKDGISEKERESRTTMTRSCKRLGNSQTAMLMDLLKEEIEKKFTESHTNKVYRFPRMFKVIDDSEDSIQSLEEVDNYNLYAQNYSEHAGAQEIETLLTRLVTIVNKTPHGGALLNQKNTNSHRLFCQLLQGIAPDNQPIVDKTAKPKKTKEKSTSRQEQPKPASSLTKSSGGQFIGKLHLKSKQELLSSVKTNRTETSPPLKQDISKAILKSFAKETNKFLIPQKELGRSGSGKLSEKRLENPSRKRPIKKPVKTIVTASFGNSGLKHERSVQSRHHSPEEGSLLQKQVLGPGTRSFANFSKKLAATTKFKPAMTGHLL